MSDVILKTAVIGLGRISWSFHLPQLQKNPNFEISAVVDPLPERLQEAKDKFGALSGYQTTEELYQNISPDLIVIASPTGFHMTQCIEAFEHGCDVFCDKPLALNLEEADTLLDKAEELGRKIMVYQPHRVSRDCFTIQKILASGKLGQIFMLKRSFSSYSRRNDWQAFLAHGGGMLNNYGAHYIDQLLYLTKSTGVKVNCQLRRIASVGDADDVVKAVITTSNNIILDLDISMAQVLPSSQWMICGKYGTATLPVDSQQWQLKYYRQESAPDIQPNQKMAADNRSYPNEELPWIEELIEPELEIDGFYYQKCYEHFALNQAPFVPPQQTREVMRLIKCCRESSDGLK
jgi:predicted dehydrogenase